MKVWVFRFSMAVVLFAVLSPLTAQVPKEDWIDAFSEPAKASALLHSRSSQVSILSKDGSGFRWLEFKTFQSWLPYQAVRGTGNDGAAWQGRGLNGIVSGGVQWNSEFLAVTLEPQLSYAMNRDFDLIASSRPDPLGDYWYGLDRPQRFGTQARFVADWGNTELRASWGPVTAGIGFESLWLGGGVHNAVLLSDNAGGFPHFDLGTREPWKTDWGIFQGSMIWGLLHTSDVSLGKTAYWDSNKQFLHALIVGYSPPFLEAFTFGAARFFVSPWATINVWKAFQSVDDGLFKAARGAGLDGTVAEDDVDQTAALYFDFNFTEQGFHAWLELARNDHAWDWRDLMAQPDHSLGYVAGVRQLVRLNSQWQLYAAYEQADLGLNYGTVVRPTGSWYRRDIGEPGYTLGGQVLGASIGPGSNSNDLELGAVNDSVSIGMAFRRIAFDVDYLISVVKPPYDGSLLYYDLLTMVSLKAGWHGSGFKVNGEVGETVEWGRLWTPLGPIKGWFGSLDVGFQP